MATCKDEKELQMRIAQNRNAMNIAVKNINEALDDTDEDFVLEQLNNLLSITKGMQVMIISAKDNSFLLTPDGA